MERKARLEVHPAFQVELEQNFQGKVDDSVFSFVEQSVSQCASNQERRKWADRCPLPKMEATVTPRMNMAMYLLTSCEKESAYYCFFLRKLIYAARPLLPSLMTNL